MSCIFDYPKAAQCYNMVKKPRLITENHLYVLGGGKKKSRLMEVLKALQYVTHGMKRNNDNDDDDPVI